MTLLPQQRDELYGYINALCEEQLDDAGQKRLEEILAASEEAQWIYIFEMNMHANLVLDHRCEPEEVAVVEASAVSEPLPTTEPVSSPSAAPVWGVWASVYHGTLGFFSQEVPFALLIATLITGLGLWAGSLVYVSQPKPMAKRNSAAPAPSVAHLPERTLVGRITGAVDVKWAVKEPEESAHRPEVSDPSQRSLVSLGDKFLLSSGLLEITYDTGAKVILQGPISYEVDTRDGGFLSVGKLTARLDKKPSALSLQQSDKVVSGQSLVPSETNPKSRNPEIPQSLTSMFAVRTPTAVLTDLGTEFGVEVDQQGNTASYVFQGTVQVRGIGRNGTSETARILHADQFVSVQQDAQGGAVLLNPSKISPETFVRPEQFRQLARKQQQPKADRWPEYVAKMHRDSALVAHYDFQRRPKKPNTLCAFAPHAEANLDGLIAIAAERGFAALQNIHDNVVSGRPVEVSSTYLDSPGWEKTHLTDGTNASHVFADGDASQRLVIHGFNSPAKLVRIWSAFDRVAQEVTIRASRSDLTSLNAGDYEIPLVAKVPLSFNADYYADIRVEAPVGTRSLFFDFGDRTEYYPAGGWDHPAGIRTEEIQVFATLPDAPRFEYRSDALWSTGRMPGTTALQFNGVDSCVRICLPQRFTQMTAAVWVTVDFINDQSKASGLLMSDAWGPEGSPAEKCHWQIRRTGEILFGTSEYNAESPVTLPWQHWGRNRWRHLAVTADPAQGEMTLYLDGKPIHTEELSEKFAATFGNAMIGNWFSDAGRVDRGFCGRMDDLVILSRAMTAQEIKEMYEAGRP